MGKVLPMVRPPKAKDDPPRRPVERGWRPIYHGADTRCPGCGRSNWWVGRFSAQCAFCDTAVPLGPP